MKGYWAMNEFSDLQAIDFALGAYISRAFACLSRTTGPAQYREFLSRPTNRQIYRAEFDDPKGLIQKIQAAKGNKGTSEGVTTNLPNLPVIAYHRSPGMSHDDIGGIYRNLRAWNDDLTKSYNISIAPVLLEYKLTIAAYDTPTLDKLQLAWFWFLSNWSKSNGGFSTQYKIAGDIFEIPARINAPRDLLFQNIPIAQSEIRLFAVETALTVSSQVIFGDEINIERFIERKTVWVDNTAYNFNDVVIGLNDDDNEYLCLFNHTSDTETAALSNPALWTVFTGWIDRGEWVEGRAYVQGNLASVWGEGYYIALSDHTSSDANKPPGELWHMLTCSERISAPVEVVVSWELQDTYCNCDA
jgi:hypothetical protein